MLPLKNDLFLRALKCERVERTPVWIMRQAGRYLPEYRETRKKAGDFMSLCRSPEMATEVTLQPLDRFDLDAAILFSDILTIPDAMGLGLYFEEGEGPKFKRPLDNRKKIGELRVPEVHTELGYVFEAVRSIKKALAGRVPLIGFSGSPWTLASYMVEGQSSRDFKRVKGLIYDAPEDAHQLLDVLSETVYLYLKAQVEAGADAVQIFDTWGGQLAYDAYHDFSLKYMEQILKQLASDPVTQNVPTILFTKGGAVWLDSLANSGASALGFDWTVSFDRVLNKIPANMAFQGNLDPAILRCQDHVIQAEADRVLNSVGGRPGHIFNLGHGITPDIRPEAVSVLLARIAETSTNIRSQ